jgi:cell division inhibitor SepF
MTVFRNVMAFLGLDDDDQMYDDEAYYEDEQPESDLPKRKTIALEDRLPTVSDDAPSFGFSVDSEVNEMGGVGAVRPLRPVPTESEMDPVPEALGGDLERRVTQPETTGAFGSSNGETDSPVEVPTSLSGEPRRFEDPPPRGAPRPVAALGETTELVQQSSVSPVEEPEQNVVTHAKPRLHIPSSFDDASRIADDFRVGSPVVMNLTKVDKPVARRLIDFASGVCYALSGGMERVAANVYLLTPSGIDVSPDDRRRMQERGFER